MRSTSPNPQNVPIRTAEGEKIREAFLGPEPEILLEWDSRDLEVRLVSEKFISGHPIDCCPCGNRVEAGCLVPGNVDGFRCMIHSCKDCFDKYQVMTGTKLDTE